jgi:hypothetical protein
MKTDVLMLPAVFEKNRSWNTLFYVDGPWEVRSEEEKSRNLQRNLSFLDRR